MKNPPKRLIISSVLVLVFAIAAGAGIDHWRTARERQTRTDPTLPQFGKLLPSSDNAEIEGMAYCGYCYWGVGEAPDNIVLKMDDAPGIVFLLPNEKVAEIEQITGKCPGGDIMIKARGIVTRHDGHNYLFVREFERVATK
jgi:hypothetical protein